MLAEGGVLRGTLLEVVGWARRGRLHSQETCQQLLGRSAACREVDLHPTLGAGLEGTFGHIAWSGWAGEFWVVAALPSLFVVCTFLCLSV